MKKKKRNRKRKKRNRVVRRIRPGKVLRMEALAFANVRWTGDVYTNVRYPVCFDFDG